MLVLGKRGQFGPDGVIRADGRSCFFELEMTGRSEMISDVPNGPDIMKRI